MFSGTKDLIVKAQERLEELKVKVSAIKENSSDNNAAAKSFQHTSVPTTDVAGTIEPLQTSETVWVKIKISV